MIACSGTRPNSEFCFTKTWRSWNGDELGYQKGDKIRGHYHLVILIKRSLEINNNVLKKNCYRCFIVIPDKARQPNTWKIKYRINTPSKWIRIFQYASILYIGSVLIIGMLLVDNMDVFRPNVMLKRAFISGSSKQGNDLLASVSSNCVTAKYLIFLKNSIFEWTKYNYVN